MKLKTMLKIFGIAIAIIFLSVLVMARVEVNRSWSQQTTKNEIYENNTVTIGFNNFAIEEKNEYWEIMRVYSENELKNFINTLDVHQRERAKIVCSPVFLNENSFIVCFPCRRYDNSQKGTNNIYNSQATTNKSSFNVFCRLLTKIF